MKPRDYVKREVGDAIAVFPDKFSSSEVYALMQGYADQEREAALTKEVSRQNKTLKRILSLVKTPKP